jgi:hypothetical protein
MSRVLTHGLPSGQESGPALAAALRPYGDAIALLHAYATAYAHLRMTYAPGMAQDAGAVLTRLGVPLQTEGHIAQYGGFGTRDLDDAWTRQYTWETARPVPRLPHTSREALWPSERARRQDRKQELTQLRALRHVACDCWWMARRWCSLTDDGRAAHFNTLMRGLLAVGLVGGGPPWHQDNSLQWALDRRGAPASGLQPHEAWPWYLGLERMDAYPNQASLRRAVADTLLIFERIPDTGVPLEVPTTATQEWLDGARLPNTCPVPHVAATSQDRETVWQLLVAR